MPTMIKLTSLQGRTVCLNADKIETIEPTEEGGSYIYLAGGSSFRVIQSLEKVLNLIKESR